MIKLKDEFRPKSGVGVMVRLVCSGDFDGSYQSREVDYTGRWKISKTTDQFEELTNLYIECFELYEEEYSYYTYHPKIKQTHQEVKRFLWWTWIKNVEVYPVRTEHKSTRVKAKVWWVWEAHLDLYTEEGFINSCCTDDLR